MAHEDAMRDVKAVLMTPEQLAAWRARDARAWKEGCRGMTILTCVACRKRCYVYAEDTSEGVGEGSHYRMLCAACYREG